ncbi:conserved Plasmodium protein, unknown function [Plasmodium berghei]|uniref:Uncharacterized protein n=2 Tax=Plasmodium berghei TaxID=5821 RepID=A0A509AM21_PLABA|nr:conserved Plasmodium protein, unknown function [Plasmodium berghei ANKA]SCN25314.1 conserved Plasmodium protein, unknown function [Plasmodium berghei]SCO60288.1 conserved Plasmodium protein, unknown function [Plasmodium berghei]SCO61969.1 conserved Plasmodium protein, unknown function [Plasmodium berghei]VUC55744.1 conserved Plasmodium protein, unknown function [Plasmodium berghei ANKA]|eukprot:XP_034421554.1 conserved Plasmodium protein, unknown function [Plasmodium berghei ANKA]
MNDRKDECSGQDDHNINSQNYLLNVNSYNSEINPMIPDSMNPNNEYKESLINFNNFGNKNGIYMEHIESHKNETNDNSNVGNSSFYYPQINNIHNENKNSITRNKTNFYGNNFDNNNNKSYINNNNEQNNNLYMCYENINNQNIRKINNENNSMNIGDNITSNDNNNRNEYNGTYYGKNENINFYNSSLYDGKGDFIKFQGNNNVESDMNLQHGAMANMILLNGNENSDQKNCLNFRNNMNNEDKNSYKENNNFNYNINLKKKKNVTFNSENDVYNIPNREVNKSNTSYENNNNNNNSFNNDVLNLNQRKIEYEKNESQSGDSISSNNNNNGLYNIVTLKNNNNTYNMNNIHNNYIEYDINNTENRISPIGNNTNGCVNIKNDNSDKSNLLNLKNENTNNIYNNVETYLNIKGKKENYNGNNYMQIQFNNTQNSNINNMGNTTSSNLIPFNKTDNYGQINMNKGIVGITNSNKKDGRKNSRANVLENISEEDLKNHFVFKYLKNIDEIYETQQRNEKYENNNMKIKENEINNSIHAFIQASVDESDNYVNNYYNVLELLYNSSKKKKNIDDKRVRALLYIFKYIKNTQRKKGKVKNKQIYLFDDTELKKLNKQVDLYMDFVKNREYKNDMFIQFDKKESKDPKFDQTEFDISKEKMGNYTNAKNIASNFEKKKYIENLLKNKSNLYYKPLKKTQTYINNFYFNHSLKKVDYLHNLLVYINFIILKYICIFSLIEWNVLLFQDIDNYNFQNNNAQNKLVKTKENENVKVANEESSGCMESCAYGAAMKIYNGESKESKQNCDENNKNEKIENNLNSASDKTICSEFNQENSNNCVNDNILNFEMNKEIIEKLNPNLMNIRNMIDINYYEYIIEPFDFFFYDQIYNEIFNYLEVIRNNNRLSNNDHLNYGFNLIKNLPFQYYQFIDILSKEILNVRDLIYRNKYIRYIFYYIYKNIENNNILETVNKVLLMEIKKVLLYKVQIKLRYNIFITRFFENNYNVINNNCIEEKHQGKVNFIEAKKSLFNQLFNSYNDHYNMYMKEIKQNHELTKIIFNITEEKFADIRKKMDIYLNYLECKKMEKEKDISQIYDNLNVNLDNKSSNNRKMYNEELPQNEYEKKKLQFDVSEKYVQFLYEKNYLLIINSEKNNSRKLKVAYIIKDKLKENDNLVIITSILNINKWKNLFYSFKHISIYNNEENIIENKVSNSDSNLIICIDFVPKTLHISCENIILDICHFNTLNQINVLNDLRFLNFQKKIIILNDIPDNWNFILALFLLTIIPIDSSIANKFETAYVDEEDKKLLCNIMKNFITKFFIYYREKPQILNVGNKNGFRRCFLITYMSGIQKIIYENVEENNKGKASIHPLLLLDEELFNLKDFNVSEKFDLLKNMIKKFSFLKKKILICYFGEDKLEKLIKMLLYLHSLNDISIVFAKNINMIIEATSSDTNNFDVVIIINEHMQILNNSQLMNNFEKKKVTLYFLISVFTKEEPNFTIEENHCTNDKELYFFKKNKTKLMNSEQNDADLIYKYYINNMISETDEQFLLFNIIDQKEQIYCNSSYNEMVVPTCFVSNLINSETNSHNSEYWQDIKNAHSFWNFNNFNKDKIAFYLDKKNALYNKYKNEVYYISENTIAPPQIYYYLNNPLNEKNTFNNCLSLALDEMIEEFNRRRELIEFDELKKNTLISIKEKTNKKYFSSMRKVEKILSEFLNESKKKSFEEFLKGCKGYGQILTKCKEKLFVTFNKSYNIHFKNFENFWLDEEKKRKEKWKELWELNEKNIANKDDPNNTNINNIFNNVNKDSNEITDNMTNTNINKMKSDINSLEKKNFRIRLSSQLFDEKEFDKLFIERKKICMSTEDCQKEDKSFSCDIKKDADKKTCLYVERKNDNQEGEQQTQGNESLAP